MVARLTVVDTTVLIDTLRGHPAAATYLEDPALSFAAPEVTRTEVIRGLTSHERAASEGLFLGIRWVAVDQAIARRAGELGRRFRSSHRAIGTFDLIIAATALELDADLATSNVRHYPMLPGLKRPYPA